MFETSCQICGALTRSPEWHQQWHDAMNTTIWKLASVAGWDDIPAEVLEHFRASAERMGRLTPQP